MELCYYNYNLHAIGCIQRMPESLMSEYVCCISQEEVLHFGIDPKYKGKFYLFPYKNLYVRLAMRHDPYAPVMAWVRS